MKSTKKPKYKFTPFQKAWINALIAQKYKKGRGRLTQVLKNGSLKCCCLGVACELAPKFGVKLKVEVIEDRKQYNGHSGLLSTGIVKILKLRDSEGLFGERESLVSLNDNDRKTHKQIGEFILNNPDKVFKS